jgi:hypothetical protein
MPVLGSKKIADLRKLSHAESQPERYRNYPTMVRDVKSRSKVAREFRGDNAEIVVVAESSNIETVLSSGN